MSKRFGRNQRRRLLAEVEAAKGLADSSAREASLLRKLGEENRETVRRVREVLGRHFIALEPEVVRAPGAYRYVRLAREASKIPAYPFAPPDAAHDRRLVNDMLIELEMMQSSVLIDDLADKVHARVNTCLGPVSYAVSRESLYLMGRNEAARRLATAMAEYLTKELPQ